MAANEPNAGFPLSHHIAVLRRRKWPLIICVFVAVAAAVALPMLQKPRYQGRADIVLHLQSNDIFNVNGNQQNADLSRVVPTEIRVIKSQEVRTAAQSKLGFPPPPVSAGALAQADVIAVGARARTPGRALRITRAYADAYIELRRKQAVDNLLAAGQQVQAKVDDLQAQINKATGGQKDALIQAQALFKQRLDQLQVDAALKTGEAEVVTPITGATSRVNPGLARTVAAGLALGILVGVGIAFLLEHLDESLKAKEDLERAAPQVPVLGMIPAVDTWKERDQALVISLREPDSNTAEAYRTLRTVIQFVAGDRPNRMIQVTSASAQEGKSATVANLGLAMARTGQRVILLCCDLRRPRLHQFFGLDDSVGFMSVLLGKTPLSSALQEVPEQPRLRVLTSGPLPPNPAEFLASNRVVEVFESLRAEADVVIVDSPPVIPVTDALLLSALVDSVVLVTAQGITTRRQIARATELLSQVEAPLAGAVLNGVRGVDSYGYSYGYYRRPEVDTVRPARARSSG